MTGSLSRFEFAPDAAYTRRLMSRYATLFDKGPVADLGSGRGFFLEALSARGIEGIGVDSSDEALNYSAQLGLHCVKADVLEYVKTAEGLRGVFASHIIEHLPPEAAEEMISGAAQALLPGGRLVIITPNMKDFRTLSELYWLDTTHVRPYPQRLIGAWMERYGLTVDEIGTGKTPQGKRAIPSMALGKLRFGRDYGSSDALVRAHKPK